jgi:hypothetical protein
VTATVTKTTVQWIRIETRKRCDLVDGCGNPGAWECVRATGNDRRRIDVTPPRLCCNEHFPASSDGVEHVKENW